MGYSYSIAMDRDLAKISKTQKIIKKWRKNVHRIPFAYLKTVGMNQLSWAKIFHKVTFLWFMVGIGKYGVYIVYTYRRNVGFMNQLLISELTMGSHVFFCISLHS